MSVLETAVEGPVLTLTLNRPESLNSLTAELIDELRDGVDRAASDDDVRCVVIDASGRAFSSGASLKDFDADTSLSAMLVEHYNPLVLAVQKLEKPVLASVQGIAAGAGAAITLACDFRIMADDARYAILFTRIGLVPDAGASFFLPRIVGLTRATEMMMLGDDVHAEQALAWGLVNKVVPADRLAEETRAFAERLAGLSRSAGMVKRQLRKTMVLNLPEQLALEARLQDEAGATADFGEGVAAFLEKRAPDFSGR